MPRDGRSILLVAHLSPPSPLIAARRVAAMTRYLARLGHLVTVLTSAVSGEGPIEGAAGVIRTPDLMASGLNWRRGHFDALTGGGGVYRPPSRLASVVVPDVAVVGWLPFALPAALRAAGEQAFDCVITSSPPQSAHVIGDVLKRRRGLCWIAELRDGWTFEPPRAPWPLAPQRAFDGWLERRLLRRADAVVGVTAPIVEDLQRRLGLPAELITNGFDPEDAASGNDDGDPLLDPDRHSFVHTGRMAVGGASPRPLLEALGLLEPRVAERVELVLAGPLTADEAGLAGAPGLERLVRVLGSLERSRVLQLQRAADTLIVVTEGAKRRSVSTGKLFEYLAAGPPILVLGAETEAARIVAETGTGTATSATDPAAIAEALKQATEAPASHPDTTALEQYSWPTLTAEYAKLMERACSD
jgi:glycosyltransferase involved in cell wall biosynthesis